MQQGLQVIGELRVRGGQRDGGRQSGGQLFGKGRAGNHRQRDRIAQRFAGHVLQQAAGFGLKPLSCPHQARVGAQQRLQLAQHVAKDVARHHHQNIAAGGQRLRKVAFKMKRVGKRDVGEESHVAAVALKGRDVLRVVSPQHHLVAISCQGDGKSGAVRAGTDHSHCSITCVHQAS